MSAACLPLDPDKGLVSVARKLRDVVDWHAGGSRGTVWKYILARIYLLEGVKLSQRPLQDIWAIHTVDQARACGISYRNLALVFGCLVAIEADRDALPFGREPRFADLAATLLRDAVRQHEGVEVMDGAAARGLRLESANQARHVLGLPRRGRSMKRVF